MKVNKALWGGVLVLMMGLLSLPTGCGEAKTCDDPSPLVEQLDNSDELRFPQEAENTKMAQGFRPVDDFILYDVSFFIKKIGSPQGSLQISIHEGNAEEPDDSIIAGSTRPIKEAAEIEGPVSDIIKIEFSSRPELKANQDYFIVVEFSPDAENSANHFLFGASTESDRYVEGKFLRFDEDEDQWTETSVTEDLFFKVGGCEPTDEPA